MKPKPKKRPIHSKAEIQERAKIIDELWERAHLLREYARNGAPLGSRARLLSRAGAYSAAAYSLEYAWKDGKP